MPMCFYTSIGYAINAWRGALPLERSQFEGIHFERIKEMYLLNEYNLSEFQNYFQVSRLPHYT